MSTTMLNKDTVVRKWYVLDAAGKPMGKTAALAADLLRGKLKPDYTPHVARTQIMSADISWRGRSSGVAFYL